MMRDVLKKYLNLYILLVGICFVAFFLNKLFIMNSLRFGRFLLQEKAQIIVSSVFSDLSVSSEIALILGLVFAFISYPGRWLPSGLLRNLYVKSIQTVQIVCTVGLFLIVVSHIEYMKFFGETVKISHLRYLFDPTFVKSTLQTILSPTLISALLGISALLTVVYLSLSRANFSRRVYKYSIILIAVTPLLHFGTIVFNRKNNRTLPKKILINYLEPVFLDVYNSKELTIETIDEDLHVSPQDLESVLDWRKSQDKSYSFMQGQHYTNASKQILEADPIGANSPFGVHLKKAIQTRLNKKEKTFVWIVLLESFRPIEGKFFYPENPQSFEPYYDELAATGVSFTNAWSVGTATHAGIEGSFCGTWTGSWNKLMQTNSKFAYLCISDHLKNKTELESSASFFHGGFANFDRRIDFWKKHRMDHTFSEDDFPLNTVKTAWGASDFALIELIQKQLLQKQSSLVNLNLVLTVSNHHKHDLPSDAPFKMEELKGNTFDQTKTVLYTDYALRNFIQMLKDAPLSAESKESVWDASLIFFMNDHGVGEPTFRNPQDGSFDISPALDLDFAEIRTRLGLVLQGGLVQNSLKETGADSGLKISSVVSQADTYATVTDLLGLSAPKTLSDSLFAEKRRWPVFADLGSHVYVPDPEHVGSGVVFKRDELIQNRFPKNAEQMPNSAYYKTAFHLFRINQKLVQTKMIGL